MEMNRLKLNKVDTNISKLINDAVIEFKDIIKTEDKENNIRLESDVRISSELVLPCNPQRINQVIGNLVKNSRFCAVQEWKNNFKSRREGDK
jgi:signal transduction histidine kinase